MDFCHKGKKEVISVTGNLQPLPSLKLPKSFCLRHQEKHKLILIMTHKSLLETHFYHSTWGAIQRTESTTKPTTQIHTTEQPHCHSHCLPFSLPLHNVNSDMTASRQLLINIVKYQCPIKVPKEANNKIYFKWRLPKRRVIAWVSHTNV